MLLKGKVRFDAASDFKSLHVAEISHTTTCALSASQRPSHCNGETEASGLQKTPIPPSGNIVLPNINRPTQYNQRLFDRAGRKGSERHHTNQ
jgi:hypothetical protein